MNQPALKEQIEQALSPLIHTRLADIGRAHTMEWIIFSPVGPEEAVSETGQSPIEYALNIQCIWRISGPEGIIVASEDLFYAAGDDPYCDFENFDWTPQGSNRCDERTTLFKNIIADKMLSVLSVHADSIGRLVGAGGAVRSDFGFLLLHGGSPI